MTSRRLPLLLAILGCAPGSKAAPDEVPYPRCDAISSEPLEAIAERYDRVAPMHMPEGQDLIHAYFADASLTAIDRIDLSDNAGSWTAIYTASQAFRWAVTKDPAALTQLRRALNGQRTVLEITGVPGLFARAYVNPALPAFPNGTQLQKQYPNCDLTVRHCKRWNMAPSGTYAGLWFKSDVSKDEYTGHVFALGVIGELVDDPEVQTIVKGMLTAIGEHLIDHDLQLIDIDGRPTAYGLMSPGSLGDFPGFNALLVLSWFKVIATVTGAPRFADFYRDCLLRRDLSRCEKPDLATSEPFTNYFVGMGLDLGCKTNWNNHHMANLAMFSLAHLEDDPAARQLIRTALLEHMWDAEPGRPMRVQQNALFTFFYSLNRPLGAPRPDAELDQAICSLKQFPEVKYHHAVDTTGYPEACRDKDDLPLTDVVVPLREREMDNYMWKKNPYAIKSVPEDRTLIESPEDFLLAYWLGRHYGIIAPGE